jgi:hypothetical protein
MQRIEGSVRTPRRRFVEQPSTAEERTHNVSSLHANSAGISVRWTKRHLEVRILSAQPRSPVSRFQRFASAIRLEQGIPEAGWDWLESLAPKRFQKNNKIDNKLT